MKRSARRALLILFAICLSVWAGMLLERHLLSRERKLLTLDEAIMDRLVNTVDLTETVGVPSASKDECQQTEAFAPETFPFDPNTADSASLVRLGLSPWMARAVGRYRAKGGRYHRPEDFQRVPGMTLELFERLLPVMRIGRAFQYYSDLGYTERSLAPSTTSQQIKTSRDSITFPHHEKFDQMVQLDLNTVDTVELMKVPGIGSWRAQQLVRYRDRLGGFVSTEQLAEVEGFPAELAEWFEVNAPVRRLNVNTATFSQLARHPYLGAQRARAITDFRRLHGTIRSLSDLRLLDGFSPSETQRLEPYVAY